MKWKIILILAIALGLTTAIIYTFYPQEFIRFIFIAGGATAIVIFLVATFMESRPDRGSGGGGNGGKGEIIIKTRCPDCRGTGNIRTVCPRCFGKCKDPLYMGSCLTCGGAGRVTKRCPHCKGSGYR